MVFNDSNLVPSLYAHTNSKTKAESFGTTRQNLQFVERNMSRDDYRYMKDRLSDLEIIKDELLTRDSDDNLFKVTIYLTAHEAMEFRVHIDDIIYTKLNMYASIPPEIFDDKIQILLDNIGARLAYQRSNAVDNPYQMGSFAKEIFMEETQTGRLWIDDYKIDELAVFLEWKKKLFLPTK
jgi:hypothetical protein